jgi:8-oxo-dGTP pyrophosphatase MutT (NUDIX family)|tara:strand:- start:85 stop:453 length:369 start_codon:yes stop_codon:yes gene_type:complete
MALRPRATGVVTSKGKVLLVTDRGRDRYSLPGGGIQPGELPISAVVRELYEETGLRADKIEAVFTHRSRSQEHVVFLITAHHGRARSRNEIDAYLWWDGKRDIPLFPHVRDILAHPRINAAI